MIAHRSGASSSILVILLSVLAFVIGIAFIDVLVGAAQEVQRAVDYQPPAPASDIMTIPEDIPISVHANKHKNEALNAWTIYSMWMAGECVIGEVWCAANGGDVKLYLCKPVTTSLWGGIIVIGDELIHTGYGSRESYWRQNIDRQWKACDD